MKQTGIDRGEAWILPQTDRARLEVAVGHPQIVHLCNQRENVRANMPYHRLGLRTVDAREFLEGEAWDDFETDKGAAVFQSTEIDDLWGEGITQTRECRRLGVELCDDFGVFRKRRARCFENVTKGGDRRVTHTVNLRRRVIAKPLFNDMTLADDGPRREIRLIGRCIDRPLRDMGAPALAYDGQEIILDGPRQCTVRKAMAVVLNRHGICDNHGRSRICDVQLLRRARAERCPKWESHGFGDRKMQKTCA